MTNQKHLKSRVRARMARTGESYASARSHVVEGVSPGSRSGIRRLRNACRDDGDPGTCRIRRHRSVEELALVVGSGIGAGAFVFHYPDFSSLYLAGRNSFDENVRFVRSGLERLGLAVEVSETSGVAAARRNLENALVHGPAIAWCDYVTLETRGVPLEMAGGGYHVVVVRSIDEARARRPSMTCDRPRRSNWSGSRWPALGSRRTATG